MRVGSRRVYRAGFIREKARPIDRVLCPQGGHDRAQRGWGRAAVNRNSEPNRRAADSVGSLFRGRPELGGPRPRVAWLGALAVSDRPSNEGLRSRGRQAPADPVSAPVRSHYGALREAEGRCAQRTRGGGEEEAPERAAFRPREAGSRRRRRRASSAHRARENGQGPIGEQRTRQTVALQRFSRFAQPRALLGAEVGRATKLVSVPAQ